MRLKTEGAILCGFIKCAVLIRWKKSVGTSWYDFLVVGLLTSVHDIELGKMLPQADKL